MIGKWAALICLLTGIAMDHPVHAQRLKIGEASNKLKRYQVRIMGANTQGFLALKTWDEPLSGPGYVEFNSSRSQLLLFSNELNLVWEKDLDLPSLARPVQILMGQERSSLYYGYIQKEADAYLLMAKHYNAVSGKPEEDVLEIWNLPYDRKSQVLQARVVMEPRSGRTACVGLRTNEGPWPSATVIFREVLQNGDQGPLLQFNMDSMGRYSRIMDWTYMDDGRWALLVWSGLSMQPEARGQHRVLVIDPATSGMMPLPEVPGAKLREQVRLKPLPGGGLLMAGFYRDNWELGRPGILAARYSSGNLWDTIHTEFFKGSVIGSLEDPGAKTSAAMENLKLLEIFARNDGGVVLLGENSFILESRSYNMYSQVYSTTYTYHFNNAYLFGLSPNGTLEWNEVIRKNQVSENDGGRYSSVSWIQLPDRIILAFNQENRQKSSIQLVNINGKGQSKIQELGGDTRDLYPEFRNGMQVSPYEWIGPCIKEGKKQLMMLYF